MAVQSRFLMCPPPHFGVQYVINPWMEGQVHRTDDQAALLQWSRLRDLIERDSEICLVPPVEGLPDLVFTANAALVYRNTAIISNFRCLERRGETPHFAAWFAENGFDVKHLPPDVFFEGAGDALLDRRRPLIWQGHGFRSDLSAKPYLAQYTGLEVVPLRLIDKRFYHLDTCFCPLANGLLMYYPGAFDEASNALIESRVARAERCAIGEADAVEFACNAVNTGTRVILNEASDAITRWLSVSGFEVIKTGMREFMKAGGAAKCLSLRLNEN